MPFEKAQDVFPMKVTPDWGKGALGAWRSQGWSTGKPGGATIRTSGPTLLKRRVEAFQLDTGVGRREVPVGLCIAGIATCLPGVDLTGEHLGIRDAPVEALAGEDGQLGFGEVQPAAVLGRVMPLEPLDQAARLGRLENLVERGGGMRGQIVW